MREFKTETKLTPLKMRPFDFLEEIRKEQKLGELTDAKVVQRLETLVNLPPTYEGYILAFYGIVWLMQTAGATNRDERFRTAAYQKVIKMLDEKPKDGDEKAAVYLTDYATAILDPFMDPPVPVEYADKIKKAAEGFRERDGRNTAFLEYYLGKL